MPQNYGQGGTYYGNGWATATGSQGVNTNIRNQGLGAMQGGQMAGVEYEQARRSQEGALGMYRDAAMGQGPSQAQALMQAQGDRNMAQQMQMAAGGRSGNVAAQAQAAQAAGLAAQHDTRQQLGAMAAQEQQAGMAGYAGLGTQMAGQAQAMQQAQMQQQMGLLGIQSGYDQHLRDASQRGREYQTQRNQGWAQFGTETGGSVLQAIGLGA